VFVYGVAAIVPINARTSIAGEVNGVENPQENPTPGGEDHAQTRLGIQVKIAGLRLDAAATAGLTRNDHRLGFVAGFSKEFRLWK
jgi:hypothetical protein